MIQQDINLQMKQGSHIYSKSRLEDYASSEAEKFGILGLFSQSESIKFRLRKKGK